ncbi:alpha/beta hydrolase-fold protein [Allobranchiibius sp. GilTou38]|uniref:alpha/beta hydrolase n=1 Tax=Allobranchiibius sp. GilTou38 TaxID=2815210 RepID=UPI001AA187B5|nr:alpha/beta hydrolase-fold protein [Allobranchiibius sp. GilTou38]MBO1767628.1 hypothetical protein [Allobranchiibius sp. GilTou38]
MDWRRTRHELPSAFEGPLPVEVCRPADLADDAEAPLLWVHDGPAYDVEGGLVDWAARRVGRGDLPPMRLVLADVRRRTQWYTASPRYLRSFSTGLTALQEQHAVASSVAVMGASLGGLTSLLVGMADERVGAVFAQSGSFFTPETDRQLFAEQTQGREIDLVRFDRVADAVAGLSAWRPAPGRRFEVTLTCGREEENLPNNRLTATALRQAGVSTRLTEVEGGHDYPAWRAALDPALPRLLESVWG